MSESDRSKAAREIEYIAAQISDLVYKARDIAVKVGIRVEPYDAYVFNQILEHVEKGNQYNTDLQDLAKEIREFGDDE